MDTGILVALAPMVGAMVAVSIWGWRVVPPDARFPIRFGGASGFQTTIGKGPGLVLWPVLGGVLALGVSVGGSDQEGIFLVLAIVAMGILLVGQVSGIKRASRS